MKLSDLKSGEKGIVTGLKKSGSCKRRFIEMGITPGVEIQMQKAAPFGDPIRIHLRGYDLSIRRNEAKDILVNRLEERKA